MAEEKQQPIEIEVLTEARIEMGKLVFTVKKLTLPAETKITAMPTVRLQVPATFA